MTRIHPSSSTRSKLSTHLRSQYKGIKFDPSSAAPLVESFTKHGIAIDPAALQGLMATQPDLAKVKEFANSAVSASPNLTGEAKAELATVIDGLRGKGSDEKSAEKLSARVRPGNVWIEDIHSFKAGLIPSKAAVPMEPIRALVKL